MLIKTKFSGYANDGIRRYGKGDGGGQVFYENQDRLLGVQADIAEGIYNDIYQPNAPGAVAKLRGMVDEANSGALTRRAMDDAGADAGQALGQGIAATNRNLARYGLDPHKFAADSNATALGGAALKVDAMGKARRWGDSQKWGRTYDFYNALSGIPSQASASLGSAAAGYGSMGASADNNANAEAAGIGRAGGFIGRSLFAAKGGRVSARGGRAAVVRRGLEPIRMAKGGKVKDGAVCMAAGGLMKLPAWRSRPTNVRASGGADPMDSFLSSAAIAAGGEAAKGLGKKAIHGAMDAMFTQAPAPVTTAVTAPVAQQAAGELAAGTAATETGAAAGATEAGAAGALGTEAAAGTAAAEGAGAAMAAEGAGAAVAAEGVGAAAAANAWNPVGWVLGAGALLGASGALDGMFADGGKVRGGRAAAVARSGIKRKDMTGGGKVRGPGGPTDDKVPAWLSDEEFVLNADAVKMVGEDKLQAINAAGLQKREAREGRVIEGEATRIDGDGIHAAGGIGVALGAAVDEINRQREQERADKASSRADQQLEILKQSAAQEQALRGIKIKGAQQEMDEATAVREHLKAWKDGRKRIEAGDYTDLEAGVQAYNRNEGAFADGMQLVPQSTPDGQVLNHVTKDGKVLGSYGQKDAMKLYDMGMAEQLRFLSPSYFDAAQKAQAAAAEKAADRASHEKIAAGNNQVQMRGQDLTNQVGMENARAHRLSAGATARQADIAAQKWNMEKPAAQTEAQLAATLGTLRIAAANETDPAARAAINDRIAVISSGTKGNEKVHSVVKGNNGNFVAVMSSGATRDLGVKADSEINAAKALEIAAKMGGGMAYTKPEQLKEAARELMSGSASSAPAAGPKPGWGIKPLP